MSLRSKIEAVIYAAEEPVMLQQLAALLGEEVEAELQALATLQAELPLAMEPPLATGPASMLASTAEQNLSAGDTEVAASQTLAGMVVGGHQDLSHDPGVSSEPAGTEASAPEGSPDLLAIDEAQQALDPGVPSAEAVAERRQQRERERAVREYLQRAAEALMRDYAESDRGIEIREVAGGYRMGTKPEYHDAVRGFARSLKPAMKLTLQALETLAVVAYKQPVTAAEISEIRGVDSAGVLGGLMTRKLIATAGRKQVIGRPMLYRTTKDFLMRFGLKDIHELPSMEEFEKMAGELNEQEDLPMKHTGEIIEQANARGDAEYMREAKAELSAPEIREDPRSEVLSRDNEA